MKMTTHLQDQMHYTSIALWRSEILQVTLRALPFKHQTVAFFNFFYAANPSVSFAGEILNMFVAH
jgi:hypothetical protein